MDPVDCTGELTVMQRLEPAFRLLCAPQRGLCGVPVEALWAALLGVLSVLGGTGVAGAEEVWRIGMAKVDITPTEPVRLSGYATRDQAHAGVADPLHVRVCAVTRGADESSTVLLVSVDSIAVVAGLTQRVSAAVMEQYGVPRSQLVICSTHSHAAPQMAGGLTNLLRSPPAAEQSAALQRYAAVVEQAILGGVGQALAARRAGQLEISEGHAGFAVNRRVLKEGLWSGFGIQPDGPVDRRVRVLTARASDGSLIGAAFLYACHCTTLGPDFNRISGDWAGLSAGALERQHPGAVFLPVIGCGADANPEPRRNYEDALAHAASMVAAVQSALAGGATPLTQFPVGHFGYAGLAPELPARDDLRAAAEDKDATRRRWAENMLAVWDRMGRLPETYPAPIHTWQFGDQLTWVFLGGEVVVDYALRLERELASQQVWVAAYTDDVFGYVASERMRTEGGYEVDHSMLYYNQPGRWQSGTEDLIVRRVQEILREQAAEDRPRDAAGALQAVRVPAGFQVELLAAEPLVSDPVNIAFGHDGRVWLVEMSDYPQGDGRGGQVRWLRDTDGDGALDQSVVFLGGLNYPSSVTPWRDGVIIIAAPDIFFAADRDGDGVCDFREVWLTGVAEANPQHRASGFEIGLDGWLHFTSGGDTRELTDPRSGSSWNVAGRDIAWNPDTGELLQTSGHTQFLRARDEFGNWFGNENSLPLYHYVIEDVYRSRGTAAGPPLEHLLTPAEAPPVYPVSRTIDRFNDLFALNRFTSACSSIICRVPGLGEAMRGAALVCEPVHNLVARFQVHPVGATFRGERFDEDAAFDWFGSADTWSRPVRAINAPDGTVWIVDMVRQVIEHPQWIPVAWQERLDVRAGAGLGRVYRVRASNYQPAATLDFESADDAQLIDWLASDIGPVRDMAAQQLIWRSARWRSDRTQGADQDAGAAVAEGIQRLVHTHAEPAVRVTALGCLVGAGSLRIEDLTRALTDADPRVRRYAVVAAESWLADEPRAVAALCELAERESDVGVDMQLALTLGAVPEVAAGQALGWIARRAAGDRWLPRGLSLAERAHVPSILAGLLEGLREGLAVAGETHDPAGWGELEAAVARLWPRADEADQQQLLSAAFPAESSTSKSLQAHQLVLLSAVAGGEGLARLESLDPPLAARMVASADVARERIFDSSAAAPQRARWVRLLALQPRPATELLVDIGRLLEPNQPPALQNAALELARRMPANETAEFLLGLWPALTAETRTTLCGMMLDRRAWSGKLLLALEQGRIKPSDLDAATIQRLRSYGDRSFMARTERVLGAPPSADRVKVVSEMLRQLPRQGDAVRGGLVFTEHCAVCHRAAEGRLRVGPPLENIKHWTDAQWITAILDPNRAIEPKFHQYSVVTTSGQVFTGLIEDRTASSLTLAKADGTRQQLALEEIESLKDLGTSLMPEGLEEKLSPTALADVLEYLRRAEAP
jgi:putative membrane-bound dehydrogenase-like protein